MEQRRAISNRNKAIIFISSMLLLITVVVSIVMLHMRNTGTADELTAPTSAQHGTIPRSIYPSMTDSEREVAFQSLTGQIENVEPLLQSIRNEAPNMAIFPLDFIIDYNQLDKEYAETEGAFNISFAVERQVQNQIYASQNSEESEENDSSAAPKYLKAAQFCVDSSTDDFRFEDHKIDLIRTRQYLDKRYDITYDRFLPFYRFYLSTLNATADDIDECFEAFDEMTPKEKVLALTALYVFEQRVRKPTIINFYRYKGVEFKYSTTDATDPFSDEKWSSLLSRMYENEQSDEVVFEAIPNEGLVEEWERSFRTHALVFQRDLSTFNPYFQEERRPNYWYGLCRLAPVDFLYAFLLSETDVSFLKANKPFPRRNSLLDFPRPMNKELQDSGDNFWNPTLEAIKKSNVRCDAIEFYDKTLPVDCMHYGSDEWNRRLSANDAIVIMRDYLTTQFSFSRRYDRRITWGNGSLFDVNTKQLVHDRLCNKYSVGCDANTSAESKTMGYIVTTLLHARRLFKEVE